MENGARLSAATVLKLASLPLIIYSAYFYIRLNGIQLTPEAGMGEFITALYLIFGASVCYFVFAIRQVWPSAFTAQGNVWWWASATFLTFLAFDEIFMIHENLSASLAIKEIYIFLSYAALLVLLVYFRRSSMRGLSIIFFLLFVGFSGVSVVADALFVEGVVTVFGREISYEQQAESVAVLSLSCMFACIASAELLKLKG